MEGSGSRVQGSRKSGLRLVPSCLRTYLPVCGASTGLWLTCGGLTILAAHHLLAAYGAESSVDGLMLLGGAVAGYLVTAAGICVSISHVRPVSDRFHRQQTGVCDRFPADSTGPPSGGQRTGSGPSDLTRRITGSFLAWCDEDHGETNLWRSFDQLVRELLTEQLGAVRVRCYQVLPGNQQLRGLSQSAALTDGQCARSGILGHVATSGREFVASDASHGELVDQLAQDGDETWDWVYPIRGGTGLKAGANTTGLVAVGKVPPTALLDRERRQVLGALLSAFWRHVACLEQLRIAERTDKASGVLTRSDFFESAGRALAASYAENEPVVVAALALEGLRHLDDIGRWSDRDALVESTARLIRRRIRTDDVIGRFSDDRFVLLLRRLDSGLGRLIAAKIQSSVQQELRQFEQTSQYLRVRVGLSGSGFEQQPLQKLLVSAFEAAELARKEDLPLHCDLETAKQESSAFGTEARKHEGTKSGLRDR
jgi:GGDEF domain-containing protein